jgi:RIO-like serine/threonine protein kinase
MLHEVQYPPNIGKHVINAFKEIHAWGVYHGAVRCENILVKPDGSVVVDFEMSTIGAEGEMRDVKDLLAWFQGKR